MATPNNTVPYRGQVFQNSKTQLFFLFFLLKASRASLRGSGEGPQIRDSAGFHKKIKLELELGILEHMVH